jgi:hypothetical protein
VRRPKRRTDPVWRKLGIVMVIFMPPLATKGAR